MRCWWRFLRGQGASMKKVDSQRMRSEYDFANMKGGVKGKYVKRLNAGSNVVLLDSDIHKAFPTGEAVNETLRALLKIAKATSRKRR
jgi:hypothetical protein